MPSSLQRNGNFSDGAESLTGKVNGEYWASLLSQRLGYAVTPGERYYFAGCMGSSQCVFPNATIPPRAWSLRRSICCSTSRRRTPATGQFSTGAYAKTVRDDKAPVRVDANTPRRPAVRLLLRR